MRGISIYSTSNTGPSQAALEARNLLVLPRSPYPPTCIRSGSLPGERLAGDSLESFDVLRARVGDDLGRQRRWFAVLVPAAFDQPVADELLVERRLAFAG